MICSSYPLGRDHLCFTVWETEAQRGLEDPEPASMEPAVNFRSPAFLPCFLQQPTQEQGVSASNEASLVCPLRLQSCRQRRD